jgi:hypothetical protein
MKKTPFGKIFKGVFFVLFFLVFFSKIYSQVNFIDSIKISLQKKPNLIGNFSTRYAFIDHISSPILNIWGGLNFGNTFRVGAGFAFLKNPYQTDQIINSAISPIRIEFNYFNVFAEYVFYRTPKWEFSIPLFFGIGDSYIRYINSNSAIKHTKKLILLYEPVISGHYKLFPWLGIGADIGYRLMLKNNKSIDRKFNSPVYGFGLLIFTKELYNIYLRKSKK